MLTGKTWFCFNFLFCRLSELRSSLSSVDTTSGRLSELLSRLEQVRGRLAAEGRRGAEEGVQREVEAALGRVGAAERRNSALLAGDKVAEEDNGYREARIKKLQQVAHSNALDLTVPIFFYFVQRTLGLWRIGTTPRSFVFTGSYRTSKSR